MKRQIKNIIDELEELHWIDYCPNCGGEINDYFIGIKELKKAFKKLK